MTAVYPYDGQTGLPVEFHGNREGPTPPEPDSGWPSGMPIHVYAKGAAIVSHSVEVMDSNAPLELVLVEHEPQDSEFIFYPAEPLAPNTTYESASRSPRTARRATSIGPSPRAMTDRATRFISTRTETRNGSNGDEPRGCSHFERRLTSKVPRGVSTRALARLGRC